MAGPVMRRITERGMTKPGLPDSPAERPVFVDTTGRRHRHLRRLAVMLIAAMAAATAIVVAALLGAPVVPSALLPAPRVTMPSPSATSANPAAQPHHHTADLPVATTAPRPAQVVLAPPMTSSTVTIASTVVAPTSGSTTTEPDTTMHGKGRPTSRPTPPGHNR
jgi:hypothetical protein